MLLLSNHAALQISLVKLLTPGLLVLQLYPLRSILSARKPPAAVPAASAAAAESPAAGRPATRDDTGLTRRAKQKIQAEATVVREILV